MEFRANSFPTLGVEQEFHLICPNSADLVSLRDEVVALLDEESREAATCELFYSVMEMRSPVCKTAEEVERSSLETRRAVAQACEKAGCRLAAAGSHPFARWTDQRVFDTDHYRWVAEEAAFLAKRLLAFGLHIHVGVKTGDAAIYVVNETRRWLYPMLALSANSPFLDGRPTGLESTRAHLFDSMPRTNIAPLFTRYEEVAEFYGKLLETGDVMKPGDLWWSVRPQPPLGTVEIRILDLPTDVRRLGALAAIFQALVATYQDRFEAGVPPTDIKREYLEQNHWQAMRHGLDGKVIEPVTGDVLTMREQVVRMIEFAEPKAIELQGEAQVAYAREMAAGKTEAQLQVERWEALKRDLVKLELDIADRTISNSD